MTDRFFLERRLGPIRLRAWGLLLNFLMNAVALTGLALWLAGRSGPLLMLLGGAGTVACVLTLALPDRDDPASGGRDDQQNLKDDTP
ncbi:hypothetical protein [Pseudohaliea sp.]|uniref:hypothetical protein n=1 Tax=Pseudohaliea sp. TaxID=2740289 RepID=UPI0032EED0B5